MNNTLSTRAVYVDSFATSSIKFISVIHVFDSAAEADRANSINDDRDVILGLF